jgi:hypothetical protein
LPEESFPVITLGWNADDLDGVESITRINIALNDTSDYISLERSARFVTLIVDNIEAAEPSFIIYKNGVLSDAQPEKLQNLKLNDFNRLYVQAEDISGSKSKFVSLPDSAETWFVKKPKDNFLVIDDFNGTTPDEFYNNLFADVKGGILKDRIDILDVESTLLPYQNVTFLETLKLFDYLYWYGDSDPSLDLLNLVTQKYIENSGKIAFSMTFKDSTDSFVFDLPTLQNFLPVDSLKQVKPLNFLLTGANLIGIEGYPNLKTKSTVSFVRTYVPSAIAHTVYNLSSSQLNGTIAFINDDKNIFFIGLPLHQCDGNEGSVIQLFEKVFFDDFGLGL